MYNYDYTVSQNQRQFYTSLGYVAGRDVKGREVRFPRGSIEGHMLVLGKTGTGKSNFLSNLISEISREDQGNIILLDPHGTLQDDVLGRGVSRSVIHVSPGVYEENGVKRAISFNTLALDENSRENVEKVTSWLRDMFAGDDSFSSGYWGPRLEVLFKVVLPEVLLQNPGCNLQDFADIISDKALMKNFLENITNESGRKFISSQARDWRSWNEYTSSTMNRLLPLLTSESTLHLISGTLDSVDLSESLSNENSLLTLDISKEKYSGSAIRIISSLVLIKIWTTLLSSFYSRRKRCRTYIFIDEFQNLPSSLIESMLSEGRKFGVRIVLASQFLPGKNSDLTRTILGNARNFVCFNMSDDDADRMSRMVPGLRERIDFLETVKSQKLHSAVMISHLLEGIAGPLTITPEFSERNIDVTKLARIKQDSFTKYSAPIGEPTSPRAGGTQSPVKVDKISNLSSRPLSNSTHEKILDGFEELLSKHDIKLERPGKTAGSIPDGRFVYKDTEYIVEVEVSDVKALQPILSKMIHYAGRNLIFIARNGDTKKVYDYISSRIKYRIDDSFSVEIPTIIHGESVYARQFAFGLRNILLIESSNDRFKTYWNGSSRRFLMRHLRGPFTFQKELNSGRFGRVKNYVFDQMIQTERFAFRKSEILEIKTLNKGLLVDFVNRFGKWDNGYITASDLFNL